MSFWEVLNRYVTRTDTYVRLPYQSVLRSQLDSLFQTVDDTHMKRIKRDLRKCCHGNKLALVLVRKFDGTSQFFDQIEDVLKKEPGTESGTIR